MADKQFEMAFSDLAHASLQELAPGLQEHLVGFQLIDNNEDDTQAVGVFGFKVNDRWLYAPVFFLNGALKGQSLLYVKDQDLFVPLQDNWVNYLMSKQPYVLGDKEERDEGDLDIESPDFSVFGSSPSSGGTKWSCVTSFKKVAAWARPFLKKYIETLQLAKEAGCNPLGLESMLAQYPGLRTPLAKTMRSNVKFAEAVLQFHEFKDLFGGMEKGAAINYTPWCAIPADKVVNSIEFGAKAKRAVNKAAGHRGIEGILSELSTPVMKSAADANLTIDDGAESKDTEEDVIEPDNTVRAEVPVEILTEGTGGTITDAERTKLLKGEMVIRDHRKNTTELYKAETSIKVVTPPESGVYDVLGPEASTKKALVIVNPFTIGEGTTNRVAVAYTEDGEYGMFDLRDIKVTREDVQADKPRVGDFWGKAVSLSKMELGHKYILITESGQGSVEFKFVGTISGGDGTRYLADQVTYFSSRSSQPEVCYALNCDDDRHSRASIDVTACRNVEAGHDWEYYEKKPFSRYGWESANVIAENDKQSKDVRQSGYTCFVKTDKVRALRVSDKLETSSVGCKSVVMKPLELATSRDLNLALTKAAQLTVFRQGPSYVIGLNDIEPKQYTKREATEVLLKQANLSVDDTLFVLEQAKERSKTRYVLKMAANDLLGGPSAPSMPGYSGSYDSALGIPTQSQQTNFSPVEGMKPQAQPEEDFLADPEVQKSLDAAKGGQKDIFDMSVVEGLVKTVDVGSVVDEFLPDMIKGMDRCGRVLFLFYWHNETFRDRYGRQDLVEMEDSLRNVFKSTGDLCLFLKQKTIESQPEVDSLDINLDALA